MKTVIIAVVLASAGVATAAEQYDQKQVVDFGAGRRDDRQVVGIPVLGKRDPGLSAAALERVPAAGVLDEDPSHGFGSGGEEVAAPLPRLRRAVHQPRPFAAA